MILRAPSAFLTALQAAITAATALSSQGFATAAQIIPTALAAGGNPPPAQPSQSAIAAAINPGSQVISLPGVGSFWLEVPAVITRVAAGVNGGSMPTEPLSLSSECAVDARGGLQTTLQALGWTAFAATQPVPSINC